MMGDSQDQLSTTTEATLIIKSRIIFATVAIAASPLTIPSVSFATNSLFASSLIFVRIGAKMDRALFFMPVQICPQVLGIFEKVLSISPAASNMAFFTISAVICPSEAIVLI